MHREIRAKNGSVTNTSNSAVRYAIRIQSNRSALFRGRHFAEEIIVLCVRWYLRFSLRYRDLEELMTERGLSVDHTTVWRYAPERNRRVRRELKRTGTSWRVDEAYVRVAERWTLVAPHSNFYLSEMRDATAARQFLPQGLRLRRIILARASSMGMVIPPIPPRGEQTEARGEVGSALPVSDIPLPEQHHRARPPSPQTTDQPPARLPTARRSPANHPRL